MAVFARDADGQFDDRVSIQLGDDLIRTVETYNVHIGVLEQPATFELTFGGSAQLPKDLIKRYPPRTPFRLFIGGVLQQTGWTTGEPEIEEDDGGTTITIRGKDTLQALAGAYVKKEVSLQDETYKSLVEKACREVFRGDIPQIRGDNAASRKVRAGVPLVELAPARTVEEILLGISSSTGATTEAHVVQQAKLGERYIDLIRRYLDRAGLFLWAAPDGAYIISRPHADQKPFAWIRNDAPGGDTVDTTQVVSCKYRNDTEHRYSEVIIYGRGGGRKFGRSKSKGASEDAEMKKWGYIKPLVIRDANTKTPEQADFLAARKLAEGRREGWVLEYNVSGHTTKSLVGGGQAIWTPDTVVSVDDWGKGIHGDFYLESCTYMRNPHTTTRLRFMRKTDLVFGADD